MTKLTGSMNGYLIRNFRQYLYLLSLLAVNFCACTSRIVVQHNEIESIKDKQIVRAVHPALLNGLSLKSGEKVEFSEPGGQIDTAKCLISGITVEGTKAEHKCNDIVYAEYFNTDLSSRFVKTEELLKFNMDSPWNGKMKSSGLFDPNWNVIEFDRAGGRIDYESGQLRGHTTKGTSVNVSLQELDHIVIKRKNPIKTIRVALSISYLILMANAAFDVVDLTPD